MRLLIIKLDLDQQLAHYGYSLDNLVTWSEPVIWFAVQNSEHADSAWPRNGLFVTRPHVELGVWSGDETSACAVLYLEIAISLPAGGNGGAQQGRDEV